eukprot:8002920-Heterocapsa_arctica.AAC.1
MDAVALQIKRRLHVRQDPSPLLWPSGSASMCRDLGGDSMRRSHRGVEIAGCRRSPRRHLASFAAGLCLHRRRTPRPGNRRTALPGGGDAMFGPGTNGSSTHRQVSPRAALADPCHRRGACHSYRAPPPLRSSHSSSPPPGALLHFSITASASLT